MAPSLTGKLISTSVWMIPFETEWHSGHQPAQCSSISIESNNNNNNRQQTNKKTSHQKSFWANRSKWNVIGIGMAKCISRNVRSKTRGPFVGAQYLRLMLQKIKKNCSNSKSSSIDGPGLADMTEITENCCWNSHRAISKWIVIVYKWIVARINTFFSLFLRAHCRSFQSYQTKPNEAAEAATVLCYAKHTVLLKWEKERESEKNGFSFANGPVNAANTHSTCWPFSQLIDF